MAVKRNIALIITSFLLLGWGQPVLAQYQAPQKGETGLTAYQPLGMRAGGFLVFPKLEVSEVYDDNIFLDDSGEVEDLITNIKPSLTVRSNFPRHELNLRATADIGFYASETGENFEDYGGGFDGRIDTFRRANIFGGVVYAQKHEDRGSPDDVGVGGVNPVEPTEYTRITANAGHFGTLGRFNTTIEGEFTRYDYDDAVDSVGLTIINDDRDRNEIVGSVRLAYEIVRGYEAFVRGAYNFRDYEDAVDGEGFDRDSQGYEIAVGATFDLPGLFEGDVFIGYLEQDYDDPTFNTESSPTGGLSLTWNVTRLTTIKGSLSISVVETTFSPTPGVGASSYLATVGSLDVDHELLRNLIIRAGVSYTNNDYQGISREDDLYTARLSADYFINRYLFVGASYGFKRRDAGIADTDYEQNRFMIRVGVQR